MTVCRQCNATQPNDTGLYCSTCGAVLHTDSDAPSQQAAGAVPPCKAEQTPQPQPESAPPNAAQMPPWVARLFRLANARQPAPPWVMRLFQPVNAPQWAPPWVARLFQPAKAPQSALLAAPQACTASQTALAELLCSPTFFVMLFCGLVSVAFGLGLWFSEIIPQPLPPGMSAPEVVRTDAELLSLTVLLLLQCAAALRYAGMWRCRTDAKTALKTGAFSARGFSLWFASIGLEILVTPFIFARLFAWNNEIAVFDPSHVVELLTFVLEVVRNLFGIFLFLVIVLSIIPVTIYFVKKDKTFWAVRQTILTGCPTNYISTMVAAIYIFFAIFNLFYGVVQIPVVDTVINRKIVLSLLGGFAAAVPNLGMGLGLILYKGRMETLCAEALPAPSQTSPPAP